MLKLLARIASYSTLIAALPMAISATKADAVADFYKGKTVTLVVAFGAGGSKAANYMYSAAPKDGSYMAELSKDTAVAQVLRPKKLKYNAANFNYLGRMMPYSAVFMVWHKLEPFPTKWNHLTGIILPRG